MNSDNRNIIKNVLILAYGHANFINEYAHYFSAESTNVYIIPMCWDGLGLHGHLKILSNTVINDDFTINYSELDIILNSYNIHLVIQHASFHKYAIQISEFIKSRNFFIQNHQVPGQLIDMFYFEGGFLRPDSFQIDNQGWNFWNSLTHKILPALSLDQKQTLQNWITQFKNKHLLRPINRNDLLNKYNLNPNSKIVLCPLQKSGDSVLRYFSKWCNTPVEFVEMCTRIFRDSEYCLLFRQHPQNISNLKSLDLLIENLPSWTVLLPNPQEDPISIHEYVDVSDAVCTINSTVGCEALMFNKPVIRLGHAVYQKYSIDCPNTKKETIHRIHKELKEFSSRHDEIESFVYAMINESYGIYNKTAKDVISMKAIYNKF